MQVEYRPATVDDLELMLAWRSQPQVYENFYEQDEPIEWEMHSEWWDSRENRRDWIITIQAEDQWRDVGNVNISFLDTELPEIGVYIGEVTLWGEGIATEAVRFGVNWVQERNYPTICARILDSNEPSQRVFEKVGFHRSDNARENESEYQMELL